jgi:hypothetical protein
MYSRILAMNIALLVVASLLFVSPIGWTDEKKENPNFEEWSKEIAELAQQFSKDFQDDNGEFQKNLQNIQKNIEKMMQGMEKKMPQIQKQVNEAINMMEDLDINIDLPGFQFNLSVPEIMDVVNQSYSMNSDSFEGETVTDQITKEFDVDAGTPLMIDCIFSQIKIEPSPNQSQMVIMVKRTAGAKTQDEAKAYLENFTPDLKQTHKAVELVIKRANDKTSKQPKDKMFQCDITISVPTKTPIHLKNSFGDVNVINVGGTIECKNTFGSTLIENSQGDLSAVTQHGQLKIIGHKGDGQVNGKFGNVSIDQWTGNLAIQVEQGETLIKKLSNDAVVQGTFKFGKVQVGLPSDFAGSIEAVSKFAEITAPEALHHKSEMFKESAQGQIGSGNGVLRITSEFCPVKIALQK